MTSGSVPVSELSEDLSDPSKVRRQWFPSNLDCSLARSLHEGRREAGVDGPDGALTAVQKCALSFARWTCEELAEAHEVGSEIYLATELAGAAAHVAIDLNEAHALDPGSARDRALERARRSAVKVHRLVSLRACDRAVEAGWMARMVAELGRKYTHREA